METSNKINNNNNNIDNNNNLLTVTQRITNIILFDITENVQLYYLEELSVLA